MISSKILASFRTIVIQPSVNSLKIQPSVNSLKDVFFVNNVQLRSLVQVTSTAAFNQGTLLPPPQTSLVTQVRYRNRDLRKDFTYYRDRPKGPHKHQPPNVVGHRASLDYHKIVHYPNNGKYTIRKLPITKLGGRHPVTGIKVISGVGGGSKQRYRWVDWHRVPKDWPKDGTVLQERVINVCYDPCRDAKICLTGYDEFLRWQLATDKLKPGDIISTYTDIPDIPIRPKEGDSHPLGALPIGTNVCQVEMWPGEGAWFMKNAEDSAKILRRVGDRVVIKCYEGTTRPLEFSIPKEAQCVVGKVSIHPLKAMPIGSPNRMRWLGIRQRSGLWQRKDGTKGRKIKKPPPTVETAPYEVYMRGAGTPSNKGFKGRSLLLHCDSEGRRGRLKRQKFDIRKGDWPDVARESIKKW